MLRKNTPTSTDTDLTQASSPIENTSNTSPSGTSFEVFSSSGPIPSASELARYEAIHPGLADRIINRFEKRSDHRMDLERIFVKGENSRAGWGIATGF